MMAKGGTFVEKPLVFAISISAWFTAAAAVAARRLHAPRERNRSPGLVRRQKTARPFYNLPHLLPFVFSRELVQDYLTSMSRRTSRRDCVEFRTGACLCFSAFFLSGGAMIVLSRWSRAGEFWCSSSSNIQPVFVFRVSCLRPSLPAYLLVLFSDGDSREDVDDYHTLLLLWDVGQLRA